MSRPATLGPIVRALGGDLYAGGRRANVPGRGHGRAELGNLLPRIRNLYRKGEVDKLDVQERH